ncbi:unnamed protein product [Vitrella brassicaformis CCMP3155]|uniref:Protein kinase domain-containing protein n=1 Tax=Vitrella brassicaformis (strain CCMP3155) TaxID=1169540 RepID=A0A0G4EBC4_VITBC|nr:unnamed protein product [Vitrella brassicaformis CCMP3155]|eukprot:CEL92806.1 unnamed protein product [Vitrella brassicaformis CCMP3155]
MDGAWQAYRDSGYDSVRGPWTRNRRIQAEIEGYVIISQYIGMHCIAYDGERGKASRKGRNAHVSVYLSALVVPPPHLFSFLSEADCVALEQQQPPPLPPSPPPEGPSALPAAHEAPASAPAADDGEVDEWCKRHQQEAEEYERNMAKYADVLPDWTKSRPFLREEEPVEPESGDKGQERQEIERQPTSAETSAAADQPDPTDTGRVAKRWKTSHGGGGELSWDSEEVQECVKHLSLVELSQEVPAPALSTLSHRPDEPMTSGEPSTWERRGHGLLHAPATSPRSETQCLRQLTGGRGEFSVVDGVLTRGDTRLSAVAKYLSRDQRQEGSERAAHLRERLEEEAARMRDVVRAAKPVPQYKIDHLFDGHVEPTGSAVLAPEVLVFADDLERLRPVVTADGQTLRGAGVSLMSLCKRLKPVRPLIKPVMAVNMILLLEALHKQTNITHGDMHGANMVVLDERTGELGLIDFETARNMAHSQHTKLASRPRAPCTTIDNLKAIMEGRSMVDETVSFNSDVVSVACMLVNLAFDGCISALFTYDMARNTIQEVVDACESCKIINIEEAKDAYIAAVNTVHTKATEKLVHDTYMTPSTAPLCQKALDTYRDVCSGHANGLGAEQLRDMLRTCCCGKKMLTGMKRPRSNESRGSTSVVEVMEKTLDALDEAERDIEATLEQLHDRPEEDDEYASLKKAKGKKGSPRSPSTGSSRSGPTRPSSSRAAPRAG